MCTLAELLYRILQCSSNTQLTSPSASDDDDNDEKRTQQWTLQQPAASWRALLSCPPNFVLRVCKGDTRGKVSEATHTMTAPLCLAISCCILWIFHTDDDVD